MSRTDDGAIAPRQAAEKQRGLIALLRKNRRIGRRDSASAPTRLAAHHTIGDAMKRHPEIISALAAMGFRPICNPLLRRTLVKSLTFSQAAAYAHIPLVDLLTRLNAVIGAPDCADEDFIMCEGACEGCANGRRNGSVDTPGSACVNEASS